MEQEIRKYAIGGIRFVQAICAGAFVLGIMWKGGDVLRLSLPDFLMLYGLVGAGFSEVAARILSRQARKFPGKGRK